MPGRRGGCDRRHRRRCAGAEVAAGRWRLDDAMERCLLDRYLLPQPRTAIAETLRRHGRVRRPCRRTRQARVSGVAAEVPVSDIPVIAGARQVVAAEPALMETVLSGGDDFEVIATVGPAHLDDLRREAAVAGVAVTPMGVVTTGLASGFARRTGRTAIFSPSGACPIDTS
jgi:thiamine-monophosphate kinase